MKQIVKVYSEFGGIIGIIKTIIFNFRYFPLKTAIRFPVWLSSKAHFSYMKKGNIEFMGIPNRGCIRIGVHDHKFMTNNTILLYVSGKLCVSGQSQITISSGSFIGIGPESLLEFKGFAIVGGECRIICHHHIAIGADNIIQERCIIMDHDTFEIVNNDNICVNPPQPIGFGRNVWLQPGSIVTQGVTLQDNTIIFAGTLVSNVPNVECGRDQSIEVCTNCYTTKCINGKKTWNVNFKSYKE